MLWVNFNMGNAKSGKGIRIISKDQIDPFKAHRTSVFFPESVWRFSLANSTWYFNGPSHGGAGHFSSGDTGRLCWARQGATILAFESIHNFRENFGINCENALFHKVFHFQIISMKSLWNVSTHHASLLKRSSGASNIWVIYPTLTHFSADPLLYSAA